MQNANDQNFFNFVGAKTKGYTVMNNKICQYILCKNKTYYKTGSFQ